MSPVWLSVHPVCDGAVVSAVSVVIERPFTGCIDDPNLGAAIGEPVNQNRRAPDARQMLLVEVAVCLRSRLQS